MARSIVMGWSRVGGPLLSGAVILAGVLSVAPAQLAWAAATGAGGAGAAPAPTTTTLPPLPTVSPTFTDGQPPASLLSKAISLSSLGVDDTAVALAVSSTQQRLDADTVNAGRAKAASDEAAGRARAARASEAAANARNHAMTSAVRQAVVELYMAGPAPLSVSPQAGSLALYATDYAQSALGPYGVLAQWEAVEEERKRASHLADQESAVAAAESQKAEKDLSDQKVLLGQLQAELTSLVGASAAAVTQDHLTLANQAASKLVSATALQFAPGAPLPAPLATTSVALTWAFAELGQPYVWGATGPDSFDCSGLTQFVWKAAGVAIPRVAADQDAWAIPVPLSQLLPGDLVFFGTTDIHHVGIYIGDGLMINAPHTGTVVQVSSIWWSDLAGFGRVHAATTPIPPHATPSPNQPAAPVVVPTAGRVPSQTAPPPGWKPQIGSTTPIDLGPSGSTSPGSTTTTTAEPTTTTTAATTTTTTTLPPATTTTSTLTPVGAAAVDPPSVVSPSPSGT
jgi:cell wall-associated NlpC family hydrolase